MARSEADVAVIIPARDAAATIGRAVSSALREPQALEVIVAVDAATDGGAAAARAADDGSGRLQVIELPESCGPAAARNLALAASRAAWISPLEAGDYFLPGRLERLRAETGYCDFVADDLLRVREGQLAAAPHPLIGERLKLPWCLSFEDFVRSNIGRGHGARPTLGGLKPLIRRSFLDAHGLTYDRRLRLGEEFVFHARALALGGKFKILPPCGYVAVERPEPILVGHGAAELRALVEASREIEALPLAPGELSALREHRAHLTAELALRDFLDARAAAGLFGAAAVLARAPSTAPYVVAKVASRALRRGSPRDPETQAAA